jgi:hypothetical protein
MSLEMLPLLPSNLPLFSDIFYFLSCPRYPHQVIRWHYDRRSSMHFRLHLVHYRHGSETRLCSFNLAHCCSCAEKSLCFLDRRALLSGHEDGAVAGTRPRTSTRPTLFVATRYCKTEEVEVIRAVDDTVEL